MGDTRITYVQDTRDRLKLEFIWRMLNDEPK